MKETLKTEARELAVRILRDPVALKGSRVVCAAAHIALFFNPILGASISIASYIMIVAQGAHDAGNLGQGLSPGEVFHDIDLAAEQKDLPALKKILRGRDIKFGKSLLLSDFMKRPRSPEMLEMIEYIALRSHIKEVVLNFDYEITYLGNKALAAILVKCIQKHNKDYAILPKTLRGMTYQESLVFLITTAIQKKHVDVVKMLLPVVADLSLFKDQPKDPLFIACQTNNLAMVKMLTQFFDPKANDSKALRYCNIGRGMSLEVLEYLLPLSDPKAMNSELLRDASKTRNEALFDLVFPVSDPVDALNFMKKEKAPPEHYRMIEERLKVVNDKAYLVQHIVQRDMDRVPATKPRKM